MELAIRITAVCVVAAILALLVKKGTPELAILLAVCASAAVFASLFDGLREVVSFLQELSERTKVNRELFVPLYKTVGIALVVRIGGSLCRDAGESAVAAVIETAGAICALLAALPLLREVLTVLMELMEG